MATTAYSTVTSVASSTTVDFGTDVVLGKVFSLISGPRNVAEAIARRLRTQSGGLFYDPDYGYSLTAILSDDLTDQQIQDLAPPIEREACKDERVLDAQASVSFDRSTSTLSISLLLKTTAGPFTAVLKATPDDVSVFDVDADL